MKHKVNPQIGPAKKEYHFQLWEIQSAHTEHKMFFQVRFMGDPYMDFNSLLDAENFLSELKENLNKMRMKYNATESLPM